MIQEEQQVSNSPKLTRVGSPLDARMELGRLMAKTAVVKGPRGERVFFLNIAPELAQAIVDQLNGENPRRVNPKRVEQYRRDQLRKLWRANYDALVFSDTMHLWNGQHRLSSQGASGEFVTYLVVVDAPVDSKAAMDIGGKRSVAVTHGLGTRSAGIASLMLILYSNNRAPTHAERAAFYNDHAVAIDRATRILQRRKLTNYGPSIAAFAIALERSGMPGSVEDLAEDLASMGNRHRASKTITVTLENNRPCDTTTKVDQAMSLLRVIDSHLQNDPLRVCKFTTATLRKWVPESSYRRMGERQDED